MRSRYWLDASGLAFYFLDYVQEVGIDDAVHPETLRYLREELASNLIRYLAMSEEFAAINQAFQQAGILYANLKGFTLCPDSCPRPELRHQIDFDFLISADHLSLSRSCLENKGYELTAVTATTWEFKAGNYSMGRSKNTYKATPYHSVELHFAGPGMYGPSGSCDERLKRLITWNYRPAGFPALSSADQFISQALHIFGHLRGENTRGSWLLEFRRHASVRRDDEAFWRAVQKLAEEISDAPIAIGISTLLATELFGRFAPAMLETWAVASLPPTVALWIQHYGREAVCADFPGTKLYLLLQIELDKTDGTQSDALRRLFPLRRPAWVLQNDPQQTLLGNVRRIIVQLRYVAFRMRFHLVEAFRFAVEWVRWRHIVIDYDRRNLLSRDRQERPGDIVLGTTPTRE
jgi:Uncharacterised nucleotidyltransferase